MRTHGKPAVMVKGMETAAEREAAREVVASSFPGVPAMDRHVRLALWRGSIFRPEHTRIVLVDGRVASVVVMAPRTVRFGPVSVPLMTVGPVATHDAFRGCGYASVAMEDASRFMEENGVLLADLQGSRKLYARFGYYGFQWPGLAAVSTEDAAEEMFPGRLRPMTRADLPRVAGLFERSTAGRTMVADRSPAEWRWLFEFGSRTWLFPRPRVILDKRRHLCGYLTLARGEGFGVSELVVRDDDAARRAALGALVKAARALGAEKFAMPVPWDDPWAVFLRGTVGGKHVFHCNRGGGPMLKIVDFPRLMEKLQPLFTERWRKSLGGAKSAAFTLGTETGQVAFSLSAGAVRIGDRPTGERLHVPQRWLVGLLTGCHGVEDLLVDPQVRIPPRWRNVLEILFPRGWPFWHRGDMY